MPIEKDVQERHYFWCPKWYWPFAVCSRIRTVHKWCYEFSWVRETGYGVFSHLEGCENGKLFTWNEGSFFVFGSHTYSAGEMCFDSPRSSEGRCDSSNVGLQASALSPSQPYVSNIDSNVSELKATVVESGTYEFTLESGGLCQTGLWPWKRTLHEQVITAVVVTRFASVQWFVSGIPITKNSGSISISALCRWPFPLAKGRSDNRVVQVRYQVITESNKSTLKIYNDPNDGSYTLSIGLSAMDYGKEYAYENTQENFSGETCDFDPEQLKEKEECLRHLRDDYAKSRKPKLGEPVVTFSEEIWRYIPEERKEAVNLLLEILANTALDNPETYTRAINQLEQEIGLAGVSRLIKIGSAEKEQKIVLMQ